MDAVRPITTITTKNSLESFAVTVQHTPITDRRLSLADLGLYLRCLWLYDVCGELGDVDWFIREFDMPAEETKAGLRRLAEAGYVEILGPEYVELKRASLRAESVRAAAQDSRGLFSESESAVVDRFVALTEERLDRASRAWQLVTRCEIEGFGTTT
ncbi:hypothetical protein ACWC5I_19995 [Kitasatospora sp. NPDC001574]